MMFLLLFFLLLLRKVVLSLPLCFFMCLQGNTSYFKVICLIYIFLFNQEYLTLKHHPRMTRGLFKCGVSNSSVSPFVHALPICYFFLSFSFPSSAMVDVLVPQFSPFSMSGLQFIVLSSAMICSLILFIHDLFFFFQRISSLFVILYFYLSV